MRLIAKRLLIGSAHLFLAVTSSVAFAPLKKGSSKGQSKRSKSYPSFRKFVSSYVIVSSSALDDGTVAGITEKESTKKYSVRNTVSRAEGRRIMDDILMPVKQYGDRIGWGRDAHDLSGLIASDDPRLGMTYGEFPLSSLDELLDLGLSYIRRNNEGGSNVLIDLGSGCGRLVLYSALTRGHEEEERNWWDVHGIEIAHLLHDEGVNVVTDGIENGWFAESVQPNESPKNVFSLHLGPVEEYKAQLSSADLVFAYSTAFTASHFSPALGAMVLGPEWSRMLGENCPTGCVAITTDRALDPSHGWNLVDRMDVDNQEVFGSTGYIHVLKK